MFEKSWSQQVDCILESDRGIILCSYSCEDGVRKGKIEHIDVVTMNVIEEISTSGTLDAFYHSGILYAANSQDITAYKDFKPLNKIETNALNTFVSHGDNVYVSNILGEISIFDFDLCLITKIHVSKEPIWIVRQYKNYLFFGDESGVCYRYDLDRKEHIVIGDKRKGIIEIFFNENTLLVGSYDNNLEIYDIDSLKLLETKKNVGSLWRIRKYLGFFICACIYDGLKIFDKNFSLLYSYKTDSLCYGLCLKSNFVFFSSFYEKKIFWFEINKFL